MKKCRAKLNLIRSAINISNDYDHKYIKIQFKSDDDLLLKKYDPLVFLGGCLYRVVG